MDNAQSGYRYPSIEMRKSPNNKTWWAVGSLILLAAGIFFLSKNNLNNPGNPSIQQTLGATVSASLTPASQTSPPILNGRGRKNLKP